MLRRVIRRGIRYGRQLGLTSAFFADVAGEVISHFQAVYRELSENRDFILRVVRLEEERFAEAYGRGNEILLDMITARENGPSQVSDTGGISGRDTFILYDTYGFPPELTAEIAREHGLDVDMDGFERRWKRNVNSPAPPRPSPAAWRCSPPTRTWARAVASSPATA